MQNGCSKPDHKKAIKINVVCLPRYHKNNSIRNITWCVSKLTCTFLLEWLLHIIKKMINLMQECHNQEDMRNTPYTTRQHLTGIYTTTVTNHLPNDKTINSYKTYKHHRRNTPQTHSSHPGPIRNKCITILQIIRSRCQHTHTHTHTHFTILSPLENRKTRHTTPAQLHMHTYNTVASGFVDWFRCKLCYTNWKS